MFGNIYDSDNRDFCLNVRIKCNGQKRFRVFAEDQGKRNSKYADREITVDGERTIYLSFPVSPKRLFVGVVNSSQPTDKEYDVLLIESPLKSYNIHVDGETEEFIQFAISFSQQCGFEKPHHSGRLFSSSEGKFNIKFYDVIRDKLSNTPLSTPARIGHKTGIIDIAKCKFDKYTIPMRIAILMHEYSHKYRNPKIGLAIQNEVGADINALYYYLGLGFSAIDGIVVFCKVFLGAQTPENINRARKIMNYISRFKSGEFAEPNF